MSLTVTAIIEGGLLKPTTPLGLRDGTHVRVTVEPVEVTGAGTASEIGAFLQAIRDAKGVDDLPADYDFLQALNANRAPGESPLFTDDAVPADS